MSKKNNTIRVKLIANPGAGNSSDTAKNLKLVNSYLEENGFKVDIALAKSKEKATPITRQAIKKGYQVVIAMGGDGTVEAVMRGLIGSKVRLGIIPTGIENKIAKSLGIPLDLEEACSLIALDNSQKLDVAQIKTSKGKKFVFFEMTTIGLTSAPSSDKNNVAISKLSNIKDAAANLIQQESCPKVTLTLDNENKIDVETMLVKISTTTAVGKNFMAAENAPLPGGLLDISVYADFTKAELLSYYAALMDGGYSGEVKIQHYQASKVKVKTSPKLEVMADGVALGKGTVIIKVRKNSVCVIAPQKEPAIKELQQEKVDELSVTPA
jgi:YegS/Rv2252/BmrU family lipid kinase